jgi:hypothetical protein
MTNPAPTFTYTANPANSQLDEVRFLLQDTDDTVPLMWDNELNYLIGRWYPLFNSLTMVASIAANVIARKFATVVDVQGDGASVATSSLVQRYTDMATELYNEYKQMSDATASDDNWSIDMLWQNRLDLGIPASQFRIRQDDNPWAGPQNAFGWMWPGYDGFGGYGDYGYGSYGDGWYGG